LFTPGFSKNRDHKKNHAWTNTGGSHRRWISEIRCVDPKFWSELFRSSVRYFR